MTVAPTATNHLTPSHASSASLLAHFAQSSTSTSSLLADGAAQRATALTGGVVRYLSPAEGGEMICLRGMSAVEIAKVLGVEPNEVTASGKGAVSYVARSVILTSERRDRYGDIIRAAGGDFTDFLRNPGPRHGILQLSHGYTSAPHPSIGRVTNLVATKTAEGLPAVAGDFEFHSSDLALEIAELWAGRFIRAGSVGFLPKGTDSIRVIGPDGNPVPNAEPEDFHGSMMPEGYGFEFLSWALLEHSVVPVPANPDALGRMRSMPETARVLGLLHRRQFAGPFYGRATFHKAVCPGGHCPGCSGEYEEKPKDEPMDEGKAVAAVDQPPVKIAIDGKAIAQHLARIAQRNADDTISSTSTLGTVSTTSALYKVGDGGPETIIFSSEKLFADTSLEMCSACSRVAFYDRSAGRFIRHNDQKGNGCKSGGVKVEQPDGITITELGRLVSRSVSLETGVAAIRTRAAVAYRRVPEMQAELLGAMLEMKEGRVLSRATIDKLQAHLDAIEAAIGDLDGAKNVLLQARAALQGVLESAMPKAKDSTEENPAEGKDAPASDIEAQDLGLLAAIAAAAL